MKYSFSILKKMMKGKSKELSSVCLLNVNIRSSKDTFIYIAMLIQFLSSYSNYMLPTIETIV